MHKYAAQETTIGQLLIEQALPESMRGQRRILNAKGVEELFQELAEKHPDEYSDVAKKISDIGRHAATATGGFSGGLRHLQQPAAARRMRMEMQQKLQDIYAQDIPDEEKNKRVLEFAEEAQKRLAGEVYAEALAAKNVMALQADTGVRGNKMNVNSLLGADMLYADNDNKPVPVPVTRSYSMGLTPAQYFAGAFGARKGISDVQKCLAAGTYVRMADFSTKKIEDIVAGDMVLGADMSGHTFPTRVVAKIDTGIKSVRDFYFRYGKSRTDVRCVTATGDHKVLARKRWIAHSRTKPGERHVHKQSVEMFALGDLVNKATPRHSLIPVASFEPTAPSRDEPWAWLIGMLIGDGGLTSNGVKISCGPDPQLLGAIEKSATTAGFQLNKIKNHLYEYTIADLNKIGGRHRLRTRLEELELLGCLAPDKRMPAEVHTWSNESVAALVRGVMSSDGSVSRVNNSSTPSIRFGMTARHVVDGIADLLAWRFGIYGQVRELHNKGNVVSMFADRGYASNHNIWQLTINDRESVLKFAEIIGCDGSRGDRLAEYVIESRPHGREDRFAYHFLDSKAAGEQQTYDLSVDNADHLFVLANGAIVSNSTQDGGYFAKVLNQISHRLVVSGRDADDYDATTIRGLPIDTDDKFNAGSLLAHPVGGYQRNQVLTPKILKELKAAGHDTILIRSPMVGGPADGGVYAYDAGIRERGGLSPVGDFLGLASAQAISEGVTQSALSSKHSGGVMGAQAAQLTGFKLFDSLVQVPAVFPGGAAHASQDGRVTNIKEAPQGGYLVSIDSTEHHVPAGLPVTVKVNDVVEAGDVLSSGTPNPAEIVAHKGIGEGRRYFAKTFMQAMQDSGSKLHRRNVELLARGLINHVRLTEEHEDNVPGETYPYQYLESTWQPREGHVIGSPESLRGHYLEKPVLHYTVGTPVKPSMIKEMQKYGVKNIYAHKSPPPFQAEMVRGLASVAEDPDWLTNLLGSYQKSSLLTSAHRGAVSDTEGSSYVPSLARGETFGLSGVTKGWDPKQSPVPFPTPGPPKPSVLPNTQPKPSVLDFD